MRVLAAAILLALAAAPAGAAEDGAGRLRVCSDPDNMPFSNRAGEGFENRIAAVVAADLGLALDYTWDAQYRGFLRRTLGERDCDVVIGWPVDAGRVWTTRPYYRSSYVIVTRTGEAPPASFDDPALAERSIGLQVLGLEGANSAPAMALAARGLGATVVGFPVWGGGDDPEPQRRMMEAVADRRIDLAVVWGPTAGWFGKPLADRLTLTPVLADPPNPALRFSFEMAMAVRRSDRALVARLQGALDRHRDEIRRILDDYAVPIVDTRDGRDGS